MIRVLIADDDKLLRQGLRLVLERDRGLEVVGEAADGQAAIELAQQLCPDIVLMDLKMPRLGGMQAAARICSRGEMPRVIIVAMSYDDQLVHQAIRNGASGYVAKSDMFKELVPAIRSVHGGESYYSARIVPLLNDANSRSAS